MQNQPYVPVEQSRGKQTAQTMFIVLLAVMGLALMVLWPANQPVSVESPAKTVNVEAVNPELRLMNRYVAPAIAPEARAAVNPELATHERYVAEQAAIRATVEASAIGTSDGDENPQQLLPAFKQSR